MSTLIGMVTFGNLPFTKLAVRSIRETVTEPYEIFIVIGHPNDTKTRDWAIEENISYTAHNYNLGFPLSVNDIYDYAWKENDFDNLVMMGNDVIAYPYAIDSLIKAADTTDNEWVCSRQFDVRALCEAHPDARQYFGNVNKEFTRFDTRPWDIAKPYKEEVEIEQTVGLSDVHNLALFKKSVFEKIGYIDVNFYPAYYEDNDYVRRAIKADNIKSCTVMNSVYFHFWSRTIFQGPEGASNNRFFTMNRNYYIIKWGGDFGQEAFEVPFNGKPYKLNRDITLEPDINIQSREDEVAIARSWRSKGA